MEEAAVTISASSSVRSKKLYRTFGPEPSDKGPYYVCPYQLLRLCVHARAYMQEVVVGPTTGEYSPSDWSDIRTGKCRKPYDKIELYAEKVGCMPWMLIDLDQEAEKDRERSWLQVGSPEHDFASRVRELVETGEIPRQIDDEPVDVVHYAWQMQDWVLDAIPITYYQQARAFRSLCCGETGCLIEIWSDKAYTSLDRIGAMHVLTRSPDQIEADLAARDAHAVGAFHLLTYTNTPSQGAHRKRVATQFAKAFKVYREAEANILAGGPIMDKDFEDLIEKDYEVRSTIFYPGEPRSTFKRHYGRSRAILREWRAAKLSGFEAEFREMVTKNGNALSVVKDLVTSAHFDEANVEAASKKTREIIENTRTKFRSLAKVLGYIDPEETPPESRKTASDGSGN